MKKYIQPTMLTVIVGTKNVLCGSQRINSSNGLNYGGVDHNGSKEAESRRAWNEYEGE